MYVPEFLGFFLISKAIAKGTCMNRIFLDHNGTTPLDQDLKNKIPDFLDFWGNPSSIHWAGRETKSRIQSIRHQIAEVLKISPLEIIFNSGGSEGNSTVIESVFQILGFDRPHFLVSSVEHPSVMKTYDILRSRGAVVEKIPVNRNGHLDLEWVQSHITEKTALVSVMLANNETGNIYPIQQLAQMAHAKGALFHCDAVQGFGKIPLNLKEMNVDYATFSAHKFYSLKGTGFLYVKKSSPYISLVNGGGQERHRRGGTENVLGILALGFMAQKLNQVEEKMKSVQALRDHFETRVLSEISDVTINAKNQPRLPNTSSLILKDVDGETLLMSLDLKGYAVSTGAACSSGNPEPSPVLMAMGITREEAQSSLRVSLGWSTTLEQINEFIETLKLVVQRLRTLKEDHLRQIEMQKDHQREVLR